MSMIRTGKARGACMGEKSQIDNKNIFNKNKNKNSKSSLEKVKIKNKNSGILKAVSNF